MLMSRRPPPALASTAPRYVRARSSTRVTPPEAGTASTGVDELAVVPGREGGAVVVEPPPPPPAPSPPSPSPSPGVVVDVGGAVVGVVVGGGVVVVGHSPTMEHG